MPQESSHEKISARKLQHFQDATLLSSRILPPRDKDNAIVLRIEEYFNVTAIHSPFQIEAGVPQQVLQHSPRQQSGIDNTQ